MIFVEREKLCFLGREEIKKFPSFRIQMMQVTEIQLITATAKRRLPSENIQSSSRTRQSLRRSRIFVDDSFSFHLFRKVIVIAAALVKVYDFQLTSRQCAQGSTDNDVIVQTITSKHGSLVTKTRGK